MRKTAEEVIGDRLRIGTGLLSGSRVGNIDDPEVRKEMAFWIIDDLEDEGYEIVSKEDAKKPVVIDPLFNIFNL